MHRYISTVDLTSSIAASNRENHLEKIGLLREIEARAKAMSDKRKPVFEKRGQLSPRERLSALLDPGMPFLELYNLASYLVDDPDPDTSIPGANVIMGIGFVAGVRAMIMVDDAGISAGAMTEKTVEKVRGCFAKAERLKLPFIHCVESAGANLMAYTAELWAHGGGLFAGLARLSAAGLPVLTILHGASTAGGAYQPGLSDYVIGVKHNGMAMLAGSALVQAATGEKAQDHDLGGAEMHAELTGLVDILAEDDRHAIALARDVVAGLHWNEGNFRSDHKAYSPPSYSEEELIAIVPCAYQKPYDVREVIARLVDGSEFLEFKPRFGVSTICIKAYVMGHAVGIIGNNGPIDPQGANKVTHFLQTLDQSQTAAVFLNNTTGYMVGTASERAGMIKHGAKMIQTVTNMRVPKLSFYIGASFGAGNYGMCGLAFGPDFLFTWPNATTGVMGAEQAAQTMEQVARRTAERKGVSVDAPRLQEQSNKLKEHFARQADAFYSSGRMLDHGMIDPRDTRRVIGFSLDTCAEAKMRDLQPNAFGVSRP